MRQTTQVSIKVCNYMKNKKVWAVIGENKTDVEMKNFLRGDKNNQPDKIIYELKGFLGVKMKADEILKPGMMVVYPRSKEHFVEYARGYFMWSNNVYATVAVQDEEQLEFKWNKQMIRKNSDIVISENGNVNPKSHATKFERYLKHLIRTVFVLIFSLMLKIVLEEDLRRLYDRLKRSEP